MAWCPFLILSDMNMKVLTVLISEELGLPKVNLTQLVPYDSEKCSVLLRAFVCVFSLSV